ncbi:Cof-type HAD-IIB family hydrolase [Vogesella sp. LYT5W]|uniref:Cof-type HAD-IIB family hydrolase n=1 Tax=Vogesella margarita TaxID=2984199 RepID=A0ABT5IQA7_9NEIS|nr:Cof-type HAD-IIB family hydrolase [Vogesella margarita]MDC7714703.1 Cof-type HAD-IIB family hydrolase [Vogesella margarita]
MFRAIATDLDGTLLDAESRITPRSVAALQRAHAAGCRLIIATGRHYRDVQFLLDGIELPVSVISSNGARVHAADGTPLAAANLAPALVQKLVQPALVRDVELALYLDDRKLACRYTGSLNGYLDRAEVHASLADYHGRDVAKIIYCGDPAQLRLVEQDIRYRFDGQLALTYSQDCYLEVMAPGVSKGLALQRLLAGMDIAAEDCAAFGDAMNDVEMLQLVGHPHLMANASQHLRQQVPHGRHIGHHAESAVAALLESRFAVHAV